MDYYKNEFYDFLHALRKFKTVYDILEITKFVNSFFGLDVWRKNRKLDGRHEYKLAGLDKYVKVSSKYDIISENDLYNTKAARLRLQRKEKISYNFFI